MSVSNAGSREPPPMTLGWFPGFSSKDVQFKLLDRAGFGARQWRAMIPNEVEESTLTQPE